MALPRNLVPKVRRNRRPGKPDRACCEYTDPAIGRRAFKVLGPWGSEKARAAYQRLLADLAGGRRVAPAAEVLTCARLCAMFLRDHAARHYRGADGRPTSELATHRTAVAALAAVCPATPAAEFGTKLLARVREHMVGLGWTRPWVNGQVRRLRGVWRWAVEQDHVPEDVYLRLTTLRGLGRGRTDAPEPGKVGPVPPDHVEATLPHRPDVLAALARFQLLTACRPQDACNLRGDEVDRSGPVWVFRPGKHKGAWREKDREVYVGPQAQALVAPWLLKAGGGYVFPPPAVRRVRNRRPCYSVHRYGKLVRAACLAAGVPAWTPNRLRHTAGTELRRRFGVEVARVLLGHGSVSTTEIYAEQDRAKAAAAMQQVG